MRKSLVMSALAALTALAACSDRAGDPTAPTDPMNGVSPPASAAALALIAQEQGYVPGRVLARFNAGAPIASLLDAQGASLDRTLITGTRVLSVPPGSEQAVAEALSNSPSVAFAETDIIYPVDVPCGTGSCAEPSDPFFGYKWDLFNDGSITDESGIDIAATGLPDADMDWLEAFDAIGAVPGSAVIGIIDTGIRATHQDLAAKFIGGYDFFNGDPDPADDNGHGTHVAGITAGSGNNGMGVPGVAWVPEVQIVSAKACGLLYGFLYGCPSSAIADGIMWATDNGANVLNISLGGPNGSAEVQSALQYARQNGVLPICAAGNDSGAVGFPAAFPECAAVSSTDWGDDLASYSNFGPEIAFSAPGGDVEDPNDYSRILSTYYSGDAAYTWLAGTSMASPQAAGLAVLLHALGVTDPDAKLARMRATANDLGAPGDDDLFGAGRINVYRAVADLVGAPTNQTPTASFAVGCDGLSCDFTDTSTDGEGAVVAWSWDFGDGGASTEQHPSHTFAAAGTYTITLTVTDDEAASGSTSLAVTVPIPNQPPVASFTHSCTDYDCAFADTSSDADGTIVDWSWDFGDGSTSTEQNPSHVYGGAGTYTVTLVVSDDDGATGSTIASVPVQEPNAPPVAGFTHSCSDLSCDFTDTSSDSDGTINVYQWRFGDGYSTNVKSPSHNYSVPGTYTVTHWVVDNQAATDTVYQEIEVFAPGEAPTASFTVGCTDLTCDFTDTSTDDQGSVVGWSWDFGDGSTSTDQHPSHTFAAAGTYTVTLTATDDVGASGAFSRQVVVPSGTQPPTASFTSSCTDLDCVFTDTSSDGDGTIVGWSWDFGDGGTSTEQNPSHVYGGAGTYTVTLVASDNDGATASATGSVSVQEPNAPPVAGFTYTCSELSCDFTDTSSDSDGTINVYQWRFGDGYSTNVKSPSHNYSVPGTYTVTHWVVDNQAATDTVYQTLTVGEAPVASFTWSCTDLTCDFTDTSTDGDGSVVFWSWDFGDAGTSFAQHPSHTYASPGSYTVTLTVQDDEGIPDAFQQTIDASGPANQPPTAAFTSSCTELDCLFTDASMDGDGTIVGWSWDFGDGSTSTAQSPSHVYAAVGAYTVTLSVSDDDGAVDVASETIDVSAPPPAITLAAIAYKVRGLQKVDLTWSGATTVDVEVYRDGVLIFTTPNDGTETDPIDVRGSGSYTYQICEVGAGRCSAMVAVSF